MYYQDLSLPKYVYDFLKKMNIQYFFRDKNILFLHIDTNIDNARFFSKFNARKVYFANPTFTFQELEDINITKLDIKELNKIPDKSVDLVVGLEILEHINDFEEFNTQLMRITKQDAKIELQGYPVWTSHNGHHIWLSKYKFNEPSNPFEPWEHLSYNDKSEMFSALLEKGHNETDAREISDWIYNDREINRISPNKIAETFIKHARETEYRRGTEFKTPVIIQKFIDNQNEYTIIRNLCDVPENDFFEIAKKNYSESDLLTSFFTIKINRNISSVSDKDIFADESLKESVKEFQDRYGFRNKSVLNITLENNFENAKLISAQGAEHVNSVSAKYFSDNGSDNEHLNGLEEKYDIIYGAMTLPYIQNFKVFCSKILNFLKDDGFIYLQGEYLWPSAFGHNFPIRYNIKCIGADNNKSPVLPWEHLAYRSEDEMFNILVERGYAEIDAKRISEYMFENTELNRLSYYDYINELKEIQGITFSSTKLPDDTQENEFYNIATEKYTGEELRTNSLYLIIRKENKQQV